MTQHTVDEGCAKMSWVFTSLPLSRPLLRALLPVREQQSVCELAETITKLYVVII